MQIVLAKDLYLTWGLEGPRKFLWPVGWDSPERSALG